MNALMRFKPDKTWIHFAEISMKSPGLVSLVPIYL